jgi:hypothetical protein
MLTTASGIVAAVQAAADRPPATAELLHQHFHPEHGPRRCRGGEPAGSTGPRPARQLPEDGRRRRGTRTTARPFAHGPPAFDGPTPESARYRVACHEAVRCGVAAAERCRRAYRAVAEVPQPRWTLPQQWHLMLAFLGQVADDRRAKLERRLARPAARHHPLALCLSGAGQFGNRVLFVKLSGDLAAMKRLAASAGAAARRAGFSVPDRPYRPTSPSPAPAPPARTSSAPSPPGWRPSRARRGRQPGSTSCTAGSAAEPLHRPRLLGAVPDRPATSGGGHLRLSTTIA